jgi:hypothetical protein
VGTVARMIESWQERAERHPMRLDVTVAPGERAAVLINLSSEGCCLAGAFRFGERVILHLPGMGSQSAQIRWVTHGRAGIRFIRTGQP